MIHAMKWVAGLMFENFGWKLLAGSLTPYYFSCWRWRWPW